MELYYMMAVVDRTGEKAFRDLCQEWKLSMIPVHLGKGTATKSHLQLYDLEPTEKSLVSGIVTAPTMKQLVRAAKRRLDMDIPGNGIMLFIPVKSISGKKTLAYLLDGQKIEGTVPTMEFQQELLIVILNEGYVDIAMDAAREAGATGGTVLHAKALGEQNAQRFFGMSVAEEKDVIYILASAGKKSGIMQAVQRKCGMGTEAGAICFSLPVSEAVGIRRQDADADL